MSRTRSRKSPWIAPAAAACLAATALPASAQDFFDWLNGSPPPKKQETFRGEVPEAVQRDSLPDLSPPSSGGGYESSQGARSGEPVPRGPQGEAYDSGAGPGEQFDPLEARRRQAGAPPERQQPGRSATPARSQWSNPDDARPPRQGERWAPGSYEAEQGQYDNAPEPARQSMTAPPAGYDDRQPRDNPPRQGGRAPAEGYGNDQWDERQPGADRRSAPRYDDGGRQSYDQQYDNRQGNVPDRVQRQEMDGPRNGSGARQGYNQQPGPRQYAPDQPDPWAGMQISEVEELLSKLDLPPQSPTIHGLWSRIITARSSAPDAKLAAIRADALNRSGMIREAADALAQAGDVSSDPVVALLAARTAIGAGNREQGCETSRSLTSAVAAKMPPHLKGEVILIAGYCAAASDNKPAAGIAGDLAIENGLKDHAGPAALKAIAAGAKPAVTQGQKVSLLDYRILQLGGPVDISYAIPTASPALLAVLARDERGDPATRLAAAEAAAGLNAISIDELAEAYRANADQRQQVELSDAAGNAGQPGRRAALFVAAENERTPLRKARAIRAFLDEAKRAGFYWPALQLMTRPANDLQAIPEIGWFAETAVESSLAGGNFDGVHRWAALAETPDQRGRGDLRHWLALSDIVEPQARDRTQHLAVIEQLAQAGRFDATLLHRLATALDALDTNVPMPLWEAASRTEQPSTGHLPDTGVLSQLQDAAKRRDFTRTVLLVMRTIGPNGAEGAHMIALGDSIRALKRAGLEDEARRLALEALFSAWPRANNS